MQKSPFSRALPRLFSAFGTIFPSFFFLQKREMVVSTARTTREVYMCYRLGFRPLVVLVLAVVLTAIILW